MTRPGGVVVNYGYDKASRLRTYSDALNHDTRYSYDAANRLTRTDYPDSTYFEITQYDQASHATRLRDQRGSQIVQIFDAAGRLESRNVSPGTGVEGITAETFTHDGLGRLTSVQSGPIVTQLKYDSLSHVVEETTGGRTVRYERDELGNPLKLTYPSPLVIANQFDALGRIEAVRQQGATETETATLATYGYRGADRVAKQTLGNGVWAYFRFDAVGRPDFGEYRNARGLAMGEGVSWSPRSLKVAHQRSDLLGQGWVLGTDEAGRLTEAAWAFAPLSQAPNNADPSSTAIRRLPNGHSYTVDASENLTTMENRTDGAAVSSAMPPDARNRPASLNGEPLTWDSAGNLARKGNLDFHYDYRNRLVRVDRGGLEIARYEYDGLNRRVYRTVEAVEHQTAWSGWRPIEQYAGGELRIRRAYGLGLDEVVRLDLDTNGDGVLDGAYVPIYDASDNLVVLTGADGRIVERYDYTPYGPKRTLVDSVAPQLRQTRVRGPGIELSFDEAIVEEALRRGVQGNKIRLKINGVDITLPPDLIGPVLPPELPGPPQQIVQPAVAAAAGAGRRVSSPTSASSISGKTGGSSSVSAVSQPVGEGRRARKRLELLFSEPPEPGDEVLLTFEPEALEDVFQNRPSEPVVIAFLWPATDAVIYDSTPPEIERVVAVDGLVEIEFTEEPDLASAAAITIPGQTLTWQSCRDRYGLCSVEPLAAGTYEPLHRRRVDRRRRQPAGGGERWAGAAAGPGPVARWPHLRASRPTGGPAARPSVRVARVADGPRDWADLRPQSLLRP